MIKKGTMLYYVPHDMSIHSHRMSGNEPGKAMVLDDCKPSDEKIHVQLMGDDGHHSFCVQWNTKEQNSKWFMNEDACREQIIKEQDAFYEGLKQWQEETGQNEVTDEMAVDMELEHLYDEAIAFHDGTYDANDIRDVENLLTDVRHIGSLGGKTSDARFFEVCEACAFRFQQSFATTAVKYLDTSAFQGKQQSDIIEDLYKGHTESYENCLTDCMRVLEKHSEKSPTMFGVDVTKSVENVVSSQNKAYVITRNAETKEVVMTDDEKRQTQEMLNAKWNSSSRTYRELPSVDIMETEAFDMDFDK